MMKTLIFCCGLLFLGVTIAFAGPIKRTRLLIVPQSMMNNMGADAFKDIKKATPRETDPKIDGHVQCIVNNILKHAKDDTGVKRWETVVFRDNTINAFALPSGKIGVYTGLMQVAETADQLAAVLGHEVGHVIAEHGNERVSQGFLVQGGMTAISAVIGDKGSQKHDMLMGALGLGAQFGVILPHSRTHESESDLIGLELMAKAGFDPRASVQLWKNMAKASGGKQPAEFMSTHPSHKTRIKDLEKKMKSALKHYDGAARAGKLHNCGVNPFHPNAVQPARMAVQSAPPPPPPKSTTCHPRPNQNLSRCDFQGQNLNNADFRNSNVEGVSFKKASIQGAHFDGARCGNADFSHTKAKYANFNKAQCKGANFNKADLSKTQFKEANLQKAKFRKANVNKANFKKADLRKSNIDQAKNRSSANFDRARE